MDERNVNVEAVAEDAAARFRAGASCAQAVLSACGAALGRDPEEMMRLGSGLGAGMGGLREVCGAVTGMAAVIGLRKGQAEPMEQKTKAALYKTVAEAIGEFDATFGTHNCKALLQKASIMKQAGVAPEARSEKYYAERPCAAFVRFCAERAMEA